MTSIPFGIYIHWPFCISKCPYCDFNSHVNRSITEEDWQKAIFLELEHNHQFYQDYQLKTIFFGGGTPSLLSAKTVGNVINKIAQTFQIKDISTLEITLEANPNSVEVNQFKQLREQGVSRLSLGIQSFDEKALVFLGRKHSADEAKKALEIAYTYFQNVSFDLIYARPDQSLKSWEKELEYALTYSPKHLSLYQLTVELGTPFYKQYERGEWAIPLNDEAYSFYALTESLLEKNGLFAYEVSNYAKKGNECQHNLIYWRYHPFLGIGPGAHGRLHKNKNIFAVSNYKSPKKWFDVVQENFFGIESKIQLDEREKFEEKLLMGFRLFEPVYIHETEESFINDRLLNELIMNDFILKTKKDNDCYLQIKPKGRFVLNAILAKILQFDDLEKR